MSMWAFIPFRLVPLMTWSQEIHETICNQLCGFVFASLVNNGANKMAAYNGNTCGRFKVQKWKQVAPTRRVDIHTRPFGISVSHSNESKRKRRIPFLCLRVRVTHTVPAKKTISKPPNRHSRVTDCAVKKKVPPFRNAAPYINELKAMNETFK